jgi:DNA-binding transcriptional LysR family regulator
MRGTNFARFAAFAADAERRSFAKAGAALNISTSTLSKEIRDLEASLHVRLLNRTTRSVALTEAGERFFAAVRPALEQLKAATDTVNVFRDTPAGLLRLHAPTIAAQLVIAPVIADFQVRYPSITLDITVDNSLVDLVGSNFDAGIRGMRRINKDMTAVRIGADSRLVSVAAPDYLAIHGRPESPQDLKNHNCICLRLRGAINRWEFEKDGKALSIPVSGSFITDDLNLVVRAALAGIGIAHILEAYVEPFLQEGRLLRVLDDWALPWSGWHIYFPNRRHMSVPLRLFIDFVKSWPEHREVR